MMISLFVFLCSCRNRDKNKSRAPCILEEGVYYKRLFRGPSTNDLKSLLSWCPSCPPAIINHVLRITIWNTLVRKIGLASKQSLGLLRTKLIECGLHNVAHDAEDRELLSVSRARGEEASKLLVATQYPPHPSPHSLVRRYFQAQEYRP